MSEPHDWGFLGEQQVGFILGQRGYVFIGTTSLYGQRPSQYDRISIPRDPESLSLAASLRYEYLGRTCGLGPFQFNSQTASELTVSRTVPTLVSDRVEKNPIVGPCQIRHNDDGAK